MSTTAPTAVAAGPAVPTSADAEAVFDTAYEAFNTWERDTLRPGMNTLASVTYSNAVAAESAATAAVAAQTATATNATAATTAATTAVAAAAAAAADYDSFDDRYLGAKASAPTTDNDGNTLLVGALYWDTPGARVMGWSGTAWVPGFVAAGNEVTGPASATDGHIVLFNGTTGKLIKTSGVALATKQDALVAGTNIKTIGGVSPLGAGDISVGQVTYEARTANTALAAADKSKVVRYTTGGFTQTFTAAATLGAGWYIYLQNASTSDVTLDPNASETIDGVTSGALRPGMTLLVTCTGTAFECIRLDPANVVTEVKTSGTSWTCPLGVRRAEVTVVGGGGGWVTGTYRCAGGGGAARRVYRLTPGTAYTYAVGTAGADSPGGSSSFSDGTTLITGVGGDCFSPFAGGGATNGDINVPGSPGNNAAPYQGGNSGFGLGFGANGQTGVAAVGYGGGSATAGGSAAAASAGVVIIKY